MRIVSNIAALAFLALCCAAEGLESVVGFVGVLILACALGALALLGNRYVRA